MKGKNIAAMSTLKFIEATDNRRNMIEIAGIARSCPVGAIVAQITYLFSSDVDYAILLLSEIDTIRDAIMDNIALVESEELLDYLCNGVVKSHEPKQEIAQEQPMLETLFRETAFIGESDESEDEVVETEMEKMNDTEEYQVSEIPEQQTVYDEFFGDW